MPTVVEEIMTISSTNTPRVSVVMPSYNHGNFIERSIRSVLDQTYKNLALIVVDNNSTDNTGQIIANSPDSCVKLLKIQHHGVIAASRNKGIQVSVGEWVAFQDSYDWREKTKLERRRE